jgi:hypothetical protein
MLFEDYDSKDLVTKIISGREPEGDWCQDELFGGKPPFVKSL